MESVAQRLLTGVSELGEVASTGAPFRHAGALQTTHTIDWGTGCSTGEITIEAADNHNYTGTWIPIKVMTFDPALGDAPRADAYVVTATYGAFRHRITSPLNDGAFVYTKIRGAL